MTKKKNTRRCIFVDDSTWRAVAASAKKEDRTAASWIRQAILAAMGRFGPLDNPK